MDIKNTLKGLGLSDNEVSVYLAGLKLGTASVQKISKEAGVKRTSAYLVAEELISKGFMGSFVTRSGIKLTAEEPNKLISLLKKREQDLTQALPELQALMAAKSNKPQVTYYQGKEGYFVMAEDSLKLKNQTVLMFGSLREVHKTVGEKYDIQYYIPERKKNNIKARALLVQDATGKKWKANDKYQLREIKFLPKTFELKTFEIIYGDRVAFFASTNEMFGIIVKSKDYAEAERQKFDFMWENSN